MIKVNKWCYKFNHPVNEDWLINNRFHHSSFRECFIRDFAAYKHVNNVVLTCEIAIDDETKMIRINILDHNRIMWGPWYSGLYCQYDPRFLEIINKRVHNELGKLGIVERIRRIK